MVVGNGVGVEDRGVRVSGTGEGASDVPAWKVGVGPAASTVGVGRGAGVTRVELTSICCPVASVSPLEVIRMRLYRLGWADEGMVTVNCDSLT